MTIADGSDASVPFAENSTDTKNQSRWGSKTKTNCPRYNLKIQTTEDQEAFTMANQLRDLKDPFFEIALKTRGEYYCPEFDPHFFLKFISEDADIVEISCSVPGETHRSFSISKLFPTVIDYQKRKYELRHLYESNSAIGTTHTFLVCDLNKFVDLFGYSTSSPTNDHPGTRKEFTEVEKVRIQKGLSDLEDQLIEKFGATERFQEDIKESIEYLAEQIEIQNKKNWMNMAFGVLIQLASMIAANPTECLNFIKEFFSGYFGGFLR